MHARANSLRPHSLFIVAVGCLACLMGCIAEPADDSSNVDPDAAPPVVDASTVADADLAPDADPFEADIGVFVDAETADAAVPADAALVDAEPIADADPPLEFPGSRGDDCGSPMPDLEPVDCTAQGDVEAFCVFSNHCLCSEGFVCEGTAQDTECEAGVICVPE